jgi:hypothetical protein
VARFGGPLSNFSAQLVGSTIWPGPRLIKASLSFVFIPGFDGTGAGIHGADTALITTKENGPSSNAFACEARFFNTLIEQRARVAGT